VAIAARPTIPTQAVPTSWAARQPECTRPFCRRHVAASHPPRRPQQQQLPQQCPRGAYYPTQGTNALPAYFGSIKPAGGTYRQWMTMAMLVIQPGQTMMNFVDQQFPPSAKAAPMMQQPTQQAMPMMASYYAPNEQTYSAPNQQYPGYF
jgi:hypothetical protein